MDNNLHYMLSIIGLYYIIEVCIKQVLILVEQHLKKCQKPEARHLAGVQTCLPVGRHESCHFFTASHMIKNFFGNQRHCSHSIRQPFFPGH